MKKLLLSVWLLAMPVLAQQRLPAKMVSIDTSVLVHMATFTNVQDAVNYLDANITTSTNSSQVQVNALYLAITNAITVAEVYVNPRTTTSTTNSLFTPRYTNDVLVVLNASTNVIYWADGLTTNSWKAIYRGAP